MGGSSSSIGINLSSFDLKPGETVSGTVYLQVTKDCEASLLQLAIVGAEETSVVYHTGSGKHRHRHVAHESSNFLFARWNLATFQDNKCKAGKFEYPFSFTLPTDDLPPPFFEKGGDDSNWCHIRYFVEARLFKHGWLSSDTLEQKEFRMFSHLPLVKKIEPREVKHTVPVTSCCCIDRGNTHLKAYVDKNAFATGAKLEVLYEAHNRSKAEVLEIQVDLVEAVEWWAQGHSYRKDINQSIVMPADKLNEGERCIALEDDPIEMTVEEKFRERYGGKIVSCRHGVQVKLVTSWHTTDPTVKVPVRIFCPLETSEVAINPGNHEQLPPDWNPDSVFDNVDLNEKDVVEGEFSNNVNSAESTMREAADPSASPPNVPDQDVF